MITAILIFLFGVAMYASAGDGEWGAFWVGAVIIVFIIALGCISRGSDRAYWNFRDYWKKGGPDR